MSAVLFYGVVAIVALVALYLLLVVIGMIIGLIAWIWTARKIRKFDKDYRRIMRGF